MKMHALIAAAALTVATFGAAAFAQDNDMESVFRNADANKDMTVSFDEAHGVIPTLTQDQFASGDDNGDGVLDEGEFRGLLTLFGDSNSDSANSSSSNSSSEDSSSSESSSSAM